jgi:hypothetical protein
MGVPEMEACWNDLSTRKLAGTLDKDEEKFFKKLVKTLGFLSQNPRHPGLESHEVDDLTRKHGIKIFQSYLENNTPAAGRLFWAYGPEKGDITILPSSRILKTRSEGLTSVSSYPTCRPALNGMAKVRRKGGVAMPLAGETVNATRALDICAAILASASGMSRARNSPDCP